MRFATPPEETRIYAAEAKQLILRYQVEPLAESDRDFDALELVIDISNMGIGPYRKKHVPVAVRLDRRDCEILTAYLARSGDGSQEALRLGGAAGVALAAYHGVERWTQPRPYIAIEFEGLDLWREFKGWTPDYRTYVWLYPENVARMVDALRDLLRPPELRRIAVPRPRPTTIEFDPTEYFPGS